MSQTGHNTFTGSKGLYLGVFTFNDGMTVVCRHFEVVFCARDEHAFILCSQRNVFSRVSCRPTIVHLSSNYVRLPKKARMIISHINR